jgi:predicted methyltransferase MtxX (methanogen marker protein 4)
LTSTILQKRTTKEEEKVSLLSGGSLGRESKPQREIERTLARGRPLVVT